MHAATSWAYGWNHACSWLSGQLKRLPGLFLLGVCRSAAARPVSGLSSRAVHERDLCSRSVAVACCWFRASRVLCQCVCVCGYNTVLPLFHTVSELAASLTTSISSHLA